MTVFEIECKAMTCRHNLFKHYESIFKEEDDE
jgi:hypothetical protein